MQYDSPTPTSHPLRSNLDISSTLRKHCSLNRFSRARQRRTSQEEGASQVGIRPVEG